MSNGHKRVSPRLDTFLRWVFYTSVASLERTGLGSSKAQLQRLLANATFPRTTFGGYGAGLPPEMTAVHRDGQLAPQLGLCSVPSFLKPYLFEAAGCSMSTLAH